MNSWTGMSILWLPIAIGSFFISFAFFWINVKKFSPEADKNMVDIMQIVLTTPNLETSRFSGIFIQEGLAVDVRITRPLSHSHWNLRAEAAAGTGRDWTETFATDLEAWMAFSRAIDVDGIEAIVGRPTKGSDAVSNSH